MTITVSPEEAAATSTSPRFMLLVAKERGHLVEQDVRERFPDASIESGVLENGARVLYTNDRRAWAHATRKLESFPRDKGNAR